MIAIICCNQLYAQHGHSANHSMSNHSITTIIRPQPRVTGIFNATANANVNAKIHANSNSVFGTGNTHSTQLKREDERDNRKEDKEENKNNSKKHK